MSKRHTHQDSPHLPESAYKTFLSCLPNPIAIVKQEVIVDANEAFLRMMRCRREDVIGKQPLEFIHPRDAEEAQDRIEQPISDEPSASAMACTLLAMDGTVVDVEASTVRLRDLDVWVTSFRDVTERRLAEEALRESEERFRLTFDNASIGMVLVAADDLPENLELRDRLLRGEMPGYSMAKRYTRCRGTKAGSSSSEAQTDCAGSGRVLFHGGQAGAYLRRFRAVVLPLQAQTCGSRTWAFDSKRTGGRFRMLPHSKQRLRNRHGVHSPRPTPAP